MITKKKCETSHCTKCGTRLDYGDKNGLMTTKNNPRRASPDRLNDRIGYVAKNVRNPTMQLFTMEEDGTNVFVSVKNFKTYLYVGFDFDISEECVRMNYVEKFSGR